MWSRDFILLRDRLYSLWFRVLQKSFGFGVQGLEFGMVGSSPLRHISQAL